MITTILNNIIQIIYFLLPAAFANMAPVIFKKIQILQYPIDFNIKLKGKRLLGNNKTIRGLFFGIITAILITILQQILFTKYRFNTTSIINYSEINIILFGALMGFGALLGDSIESFIKRRLNINPGEKFIFLDQTDWVFGSIICTSIYIKTNIKTFILALLIMFVLHIIIKHISFFLKIENKKW